MSQQPAVAVLGLGAMGHAFAANLLKKGFPVYGWNRPRARGKDRTPPGLTLRRRHHGKDAASGEGGAEAGRDTRADGHHRR